MFVVGLSLAGFGCWRLVTGLVSLDDDDDDDEDADEACFPFCLLPMLDLVLYVLCLYVFSLSDKEDAVPAVFGFGSLLAGELPGATTVTNGRVGLFDEDFIEVAFVIAVLLLPEFII